MQERMLEHVTKLFIFRKGALWAVGAFDRLQFHSDGMPYLVQSILCKMEKLKFLQNCKNVPNVYIHFTAVSS